MCHLTRYLQLNNQVQYLQQWSEYNEIKEKNEPHFKQTDREQKFKGMVWKDSRVQEKVNDDGVIFFQYYCKNQNYLPYHFLTNNKIRRSCDENQTTNNLFSERKWIDKAGKL